ncbi:putative ferredoxin C 2, chloroplastic [Cocos nucifera]|uniref:Putative ferredoxin C 2, chloroplastic n=1 Tax=Cocos nucifera TaxID=13894 RepID=A0A8K0HY58_COCNU|nr:putative ferredoxin C 2, chloroplastic [Cocos nucifera]
MDLRVLPCNGHPCFLVGSSPNRNSLLPRPKDCSQRSRPNKITAEQQQQVSRPTTTSSSSSSSSSVPVPTHRVTVHDRQRGVVHQFLVPEDQYILHTAESQNISLPFACRHGCCTSCAVRIRSGQIKQPEALGISAELKSKVVLLLLFFILRFTGKDSAIN